MKWDDLQETNLVLGLGYSSSAKKTTAVHNLDHVWKSSLQPSLTLNLSGESDGRKVDFDCSSSAFKDQSRPAAVELLFRQNSTGASSFSAVGVKRERDQICSSEEVEIQRGSCEEEDGFNERKKLRLSKTQSSLLEESFKRHSTLNPSQKQELARELKLRPRQVEVWFQNRRARTKLKQTELDCEFLKKCYDSLTDENKRLHKELRELKALKSVRPKTSFLQLPAATLSMCPSCERINSSDAVTAGNAARIGPFAMTSKQLFYTNPSAAC